MTSSSILKRRLRSTSVVTLGLLAVTATFPLLLVLAAIFDLIRALAGNRRFVAVRLLLFGWVYLAAEVLGILALGALWLVSGGGRVRPVFIGGTYAVQRWWAGTLFTVIRRLFSLRLEVEGEEALSPGPILVFMRHASIIDNLLPNVLITSTHGIKLRYVLKRELLSDPALDIAGTRLPNYFVDRSVGGAAEVESVRKLGMGLEPDEGVLIYPEGTRFTPERRARALERMKDSVLLPRAEALRGLLPPRPGGPLALLDVEPSADVVVVSHSGLGGFSHIRNILEGGLVGNTVRVRFERYSIGSIPTGESERVDWLYDRWAEIDRWIHE